ncbi:MAG: chemotaxis protein MotA [Halothiobacillus sp. 14-56-357]|nr:MAG: chemotaxis protein MotA [Halothiobacillus sp. 14-56-357]
MNPATLLGIFGGFGIVIGAIFLSSNHVSDYFSPTSLFLVLGGTIAATLISYPLHEVLRVFRVFTIVLRNERLYTERDIAELVDVAKLRFQGQINRADERLTKINNPFLRTGMQMVLDGASNEDIMTLLQWRIGRMRARERVLGLINMLHAMDAAHFADIGVNMALALITTLYGILLANMIFKPIALKLERRTEQRVMVMNMMVEGVMLMQQQRSPAFIRETLQSFLAQSEDELREGASQPGKRTGSVRGTR